MPDITIVSAILTSIKTATDIAKLLRESDSSLERAEMKLKLADLIGSLADTRTRVIEVQEEIVGRDRRIAELEEALRTKEEVVRCLDGYYKKNAVGNATGHPFCLSCWEGSHRLHQLVQKSGNRFTNKCGHCGHEYTSRLTPNRFPETGPGV